MSCSITTLIHGRELTPCPWIHGTTWSIPSMMQTKQTTNVETTNVKVSRGNTRYFTILNAPTTQATT